MKRERFPCRLQLGITTAMARALETFEVHSTLSMSDHARIAIAEYCARHGLNVLSWSEANAPGRANGAAVEERV